MVGYVSSFSWSGRYPMFVDIWWAPKKTRRLFGGICKNTWGHKVKPYWEEWNKQQIYGHFRKGRQKPQFLAPQSRWLEWIHVQNLGPAKVLVLGSVFKLDVLGGQNSALVGNSFDLKKSVERILCILHRLLHLLLLRTTMTTATG